MSSFKNSHFAGFSFMFSSLSPSKTIFNCWRCVSIFAEYIQISLAKTVTNLLVKPLSVWSINIQKKTVAAVLYLKDIFRYSTKFPSVKKAMRWLEFGWTSTWLHLLEKTESKKFRAPSKWDKLWNMGNLDKGNFNRIP